MKRFFAAFLIVVVAMSLVACSSESGVTNRYAKNIVYSGEFQITHLDMVSASTTGLAVECYASMVNDDITLVARIDKILYAQFKEGDVVFCEISINENIVHEPYLIKIDGYDDWYHIVAQTGLEN